MKPDPDEKDILDSVENVEWLLAII